MIPDIVKNDLLVWAVKWQLVGHHYVHDDTEAPNVDLLVIATKDILWGHEVRTTSRVTELLRCAIKRCPDLVRRSKVDQLYVKTINIIKHDVLKLYVAVTNFHTVHVIDCTEELIENPRGLLLRPPPYAGLVLLAIITRCEKRPALADGHDDVDSIVVLEELVHRDDVRMFKLALNVNLVKVGLT